MEQTVLRALLGVTLQTWAILPDVIDGPR